MIREGLTLACMLIGGGFMLIAAIGLVRLPDLFTRMHAATKAGTFGVSFLMLAAAIYFGEMVVTTHAVLIIIFFFLTAPVAAPIVALTAYLVHEPLWEKTVVDEYKQYREQAQASRERAEEDPAEDQGAGTERS